MQLVKLRSSLLGLLRKHRSLSNGKVSEIWRHFKDFHWVLHGFADKCTFTAGRMEPLIEKGIFLLL